MRHVGVEHSDADIGRIDPARASRSTFRSGEAAIIFAWLDHRCTASSCRAMSFSSAARRERRRRPSTAWSARIASIRRRAASISRWAPSRTCSARPPAARSATSSASSLRRLGESIATTSSATASRPGSRPGSARSTEPGETHRSEPRRGDGSGRCSPIRGRARRSPGRRIGRRSRLGRRVRSRRRHGRASRRRGIRRRGCAACRRRRGPRRSARPYRHLTTSPRVPLTTPARRSLRRAITRSPTANARLSVISSSSPRRPSRAMRSRAIALRSAASERRWATMTASPASGWRAASHQSSTSVARSSSAVGRATRRP